MLLRPTKDKKPAFCNIILSLSHLRFYLYNNSHYGLKGHDNNSLRTLCCRRSGAIPKSSKDKYLTTTKKPFKSLGPEPAFGRLGLCGSSGGYSSRGYTSECQGEPPPVQNRYKRSAKGSSLRSKTVTNGVPRGASGPKPLRTGFQGEPLLDQNCYERSVKGSPLWSKTVTNAGPKQAFRCLYYTILRYQTFKSSRLQRFTLTHSFIHTSTLSHFTGAPNGRREHEIP